jgi:hypothetical protein
MTVNATPPKWTPPPPAPEVKPIVHRTVTLRVDLRALAALGGALIIIGSFLPWAPQFQPVVRVFGPATSGGWPILLRSAGDCAAIRAFRTPRVKLPAAALGFAADAGAEERTQYDRVGAHPHRRAGDLTPDGYRHWRVSHAGRITHRRAGRAGAAAASA